MLGMFALAWATIGTAGKAQAQVMGPAKKVIRANEFVLEDENGKARAGLAAFKDGPGLGLSDAKGTPRAGLAAFKDGPVLDAA
jgi:hypothetical protein